MRFVFAAAACAALAGCGGVNRPGEVVPIEPAPPATLTVAGDYMQVSVCVLQRIPADGPDKPEFTELKPEGRAVIRLNLTAGAFYNSVQLFEASFIKQSDHGTAVAVRERGSLTQGADYWKKKIGDLAQSCAQQTQAPQATQAVKPTRHR